MADELLFYTNPASRGRIVRWMLEEVGVSYRTEIIAHGAEMKAPTYRTINPMGKVSALRHGETVDTEAAAICAYLDDAFPEALLAPPAGDPRRGVYYRWLLFGAGPLEAAVSNRVLGFVVPEDRERMIGYGTYADVINALEGALDKPGFLLGERFSAADAYLGSQIGFGMQFGTMEKRPAFSAYWERISRRPAAVRAREIDDALVPSPKSD